MQNIRVQGTSVPALGFGTAGLTGNTCVEGVRHAIELGYRQIDTARMYANEAEVGRGVKASGVPREEVFIVTKLGGGDMTADRVPVATDESLRALGVDYIDLHLIHFPTPEVPFAETLEAMVKQKADGKIRHIGVSNFRAAQLREAMAQTPILANQVPYTPGMTQRGLCEIARTDGVILTAYSPLRGPGVGDPAMKEIAGARGKTVQQVALRWLLQQPNVSPIPRSSSAAHRASNADVFDFELGDDEMALISAIRATSE
jgi:diketogulonate reductase-like aldo/keto reductase